MVLKVAQLWLMGVNQQTSPGIGTHGPRKAIKELRFLWKRGILKRGQKIPSMPVPGTRWFEDEMYGMGKHHEISGYVKYIV